MNAVASRAHTLTGAMLRLSASKLCLGQSFSEPAGVLTRALIIDTKKSTPRGAFIRMAVGQGFEPREPLGSTVFKTAAFDHSASPPKLS